MQVGISPKVAMKIWHEICTVFTRGLAFTRKRKGVQEIEEFGVVIMKDDEIMNLLYRIH